MENPESSLKADATAAQEERGAWRPPTAAPSMAGGAAPMSEPQVSMSPAPTEFGGHPYWRGDRLVDPRVSESDRILVMLMHLWWVFLPVMGVAALFPLVAWIIRQSSSAYVDDHGREILNMQLTGLLFLIPPLWPFGVVWALYQIVSAIRAALAGSRREYFRYPITFRPLG